MKAKPKPANEQPTLLVDSEVIRQIRQHARSSPATEICGVLIGQDRDRKIEVMASIEGQNAEEAGAHVTFTQDTWEHIYAVKDKKFPAERIVGWYHSHPGFGVFLSDHDTFIHKNFFSSPGQVAWVFDPHSDEEGCFGWVDGRIERLARIGVIDRRGGERAEESAKSGPAADPRNFGAAFAPEEREPTPIRVRHLEVDEQTDKNGLSLEDLVTRVFVLLSVLALGFALSWYLFPKVMVIPVPVDPRTGLPIDPSTGQILSDPRYANSNTQRAAPNQPGAAQSDSGKATPNQPGQPSSSTHGGQQKGNDAKPK
jgi:proteasome lid subunit RPN8/RPN11